MQGNSSASSELTALQRLAAAGSEPLLAVGRALGAHLVHSLGSTTSVAITGGLGLIRLGLGELQHPDLALQQSLNTVTFDMMMLALS